MVSTRRDRERETRNAKGEEGERLANRAVEKEREEARKRVVSASERKQGDPQSRHVSLAMLYAGRVPCFTLPPSFSRMLAFELVPTLFLCLPFSMLPSFSDVCAVRARSLSRSPLPLVSWFLSSRSFVQYSGRE